MAVTGEKITALPPASSALLTDIIPAVQDGVTVRETLQQIKTLFGCMVRTEVTGISQSMIRNNIYLPSNAALVTCSLPTTSSVGDLVSIAGKGAGGWIVSQAASQQIHVGNSATTLGTGGSLASTNQFDSVQLICLTANTIWSVLGKEQGTLTIV